MPRFRRRNVDSAKRSCRDEYDGGLNGKLRRNDYWIGRADRPCRARELLTILSSLLGGTFLIVVAIGLLLMPVASPNVTHALAGIAAALGVFVIVVALVRRNSTELAVTNRRVIAKFGLIARSTVEMNLAKVESVRVEQTVMGRLFGFGSIIVTGTGATMDPIRFIADPIAFRQAIQKATDALPKA